MTANLQIQPLGPAIGAVVSGIDLSQTLTEGARERIHAALLAHHVLFFENQPLTPVQHRALAAHFGPLHVHPLYPHAENVPEIIVLDTSSHNQPDNDNWHTDVTFIDTPPMGALLSAKVLPPYGGDTLWASGIAAWEALSPRWHTMLDGLTAEHDMLKSFPAYRFNRSPEEHARWTAARDRHPPVIHPVVRTHPESGRRGLFVNHGFTTRILELSKHESDHLLRFLFEHLARPETSMRWRWKVGDLAFWDNRLTLHYATNDYLPHRRIMHRATILGDQPR